MEGTILILAIAPTVVPIMFKAYSWNALNFGTTNIVLTPPRLPTIAVPQPLSQHFE